MDIKKLRKIFFSTLYLSSFTFGGGYVIVTLLKKKFVDELHWIDEKEMLDLVAIAQSSPGAIAVNGSIVVGYKICGIPGIICAVFGAIIPPFVIISVISSFYTLFKNNTVIKALLYGMRSGVSAVIISVVYDMTKNVMKEKDISKIIILIASFIANYYFNVNVVLIILIVIAYGLIKAFIKGKKEKEVLK
ncbi:chromate transporter [Lachnospira multipara]|uniref:chromate transporter n=1 Tax=Lachnospira multipara TaxID=28051 RepID=UPI0004E1897E|nr:chromate transporter [Lachnospira multipara]